MVSSTGLGAMVVNTAVAEIFDADAAVGVGGSSTTIPEILLAMITPLSAHGMYRQVWKLD